MILAFAILVIIHEFGHFLFARIFGVRVEKFYIFFDPWFELLKWKPKKYFGIFGKSVRRSSDKDDTAAGQSKINSGAIRSTGLDGCLWAVIAKSRE